METETLFTTSKWDILKEISLKPSSPLEIANKLKTTIANVSQQIRLLEASGLVKKTKVSNSEAGKPRALYSLTGDFAYMTIATRGVAKKSIISLSPDQVFLSRVWLLSNSEVARVLSKFYYTNDSFFKNISELYFKSFNGNVILLEGKSNVDSKVKSSYDIVDDGKKYSINFQLVKNRSDNSELLFLGESGQ